MPTSTPPTDGQSPAQSMGGQPSGNDLVVRLAARGDGVTADGRYSAMAAPGDHILPDGTVEHGPHHQTPPCRHYGKCGGCQLQHVDDAAYADFLVGRVRGALAAQGLACDVVLPPHISPPKSRRRASIKAQKNGAHLVLGFNEGRSHRIVDLKQCEILAPQLFAILPAFRTLLGTLLGRKGAATIDLTLLDNGVDALIRGVRVDGLAADEALFDFTTRHPFARLAIDSGDGPEDRWAPEPAMVRLGDVPVAMPHAAFLQATVDGQQALVAAVERAIAPADGGPAGAAPVADLFAGLGTFALALARNGAVHGVEGARDAVGAMQRAANL
ncbi:MAG: class I SAM-dependent RNA methyltransferase, partial [Sphingopyxis sp.]